MKMILFFPTLTAIGLSMIFLSCTKASDDTLTKSCLTEQGSQLNPDQSADCDFSATLTDTEIADLLHMREEEKVARDVYLKFSEMYNIPVFSNIAQSEQRHMDAVLNLITGYGLADPVAGMSTGEFTTAFQSLYDELIAKGSTQSEALMVGVEIEKLDIADLEECIASTDLENIKRVYNNLLTGSENHLNAFLRKL